MATSDGAALTHGPYTLGRRLGAGGMAEVFEAERADRPGVRVALKRVLPAHAGEREFELMFADEIAIARRITHTNVLSVVDADPSPPAQFLALELVDGVDAGRFQNAARRGELSLSTNAIAWLGACVARGLHAAHEATDDRGAPMGVVHRDVSPGNVFVTREGAVKLGDFGVAFARERSARTTTGAVKGKVSFMAPEQLSGLSVDRRADVFSLACALHAVAVGDSPFRSMDELSAILRGHELPMHDAIPEALVPPLRKALGATPSSRFETALDFALALDPLVLDERAAREELALACGSVERREPARPLFDALWSLDAMGLDEPELPPPTLAARPSAQRPIQPELAPPRAEPATSTSTAEAPRTKRISAAILLLILAIFAAGAALRRSRSEPDPSTPSPPVARVAALDASSPARVEPPSRPIATVDASTAASTEGVRAARTIDPRPQRRVTSAVDAGRASEPSAAPEGARAWIRVGFAGDPVAGARVLVDGVPRGWAPAVLSLPVGSRRVIVRSPEGATLLDQSVTIAEEHTRVSPRVVLVSR